MPLFTLTELKASRYAARIGYCVTDHRFLALANEAQRRLVEMPARWIGTIQKLDLLTAGRHWFCVPSGVTTILAAYNARNRGRADLRNGWHEFGGIADFSGAPNPSWLQPWGGDAPPIFVSEDGLAPLVAEPPVSPFMLRAYANFADDVGQVLRVFGLLPWNNLPIVDETCPGMDLTVSNRAGAVETSPVIGAVTNITKGVTKGPVDVYAVDGQGTETFIQQLESWETSSLRQRWIMESCPRPCLLKAIVKLSHIPVVNDCDFFVLASLDAVGTGMLSLKRKEERAYDESAGLWGEAIGLLDEATRNLTGDRVTINWRGWGLKSRFAGWI